MVLARNIALTLFGRVLRIILRLLSGIITARILGPADLGKYNLLQLIPGLAANLANLGINSSTVYFYGKGKYKLEELASNVLALGAGLGLFLALLLTCSSGYLIHLLPAGIDVNLLRLIVFAIPFQLTAAYLISLLQAQNLIPRYNLYYSLTSAANFIFVILFLLGLNSGLPGRVWAYITGSAAGALITGWGIKTLFKKDTPVDMQLILNLVKFGWVINLTAVIQFLNYRLDILLVSYFCPPADIGYYAVAVTLAEFLWYLPNSIGVVIFPISSSAKGDSKYLIASACRHNLLLILTGAVFVCLTGEALIKIMFSEAYLPSRGPLIYLLPGIVSFSLHKVLSPDLTARGRQAVVTVIAFIAFICNLSLNLLLIPHYGIKGAALASSVSYSAAALIMVDYYIKTFKLQAKDLLIIKKEDLQFLRQKLFSGGQTLSPVNFISPGLFIKRSIDIIISLLLLILLWPFLILIAAAVVLETGWPPVFVQTRAGWYGRPFKIYKFRTMTRDADRFDEYMVAGESDPRITRVGRFLRAKSLDELPQLINVLKGEMSLIGPRPTLPYQVKRYNRRQRKRLDMRPGMTGWAQVNGRNSLSWRERIEMDIWYVENFSLKLDLYIAWKTIIVLLSKRESTINPLEDEFARPDVQDEQIHEN